MKAFLLFGTLILCKISSKSNKNCDHRSTDRQTDKQKDASDDRLNGSSSPVLSATPHSYGKGQNPLNVFLWNLSKLIMSAKYASKPNLVTIRRVGASEWICEIYDDFVLFSRIDPEVTLPNQFPRKKLILERRVFMCRYAFCRHAFSHENQKFFNSLTTGPENCQIWHFWGRDFKIFC